MAVTLEVKYFNTFLIKSAEVTHQVVGTGNASTTALLLQQAVVVQFMLYQTPNLNFRYILIMN